MLPNFAGAPHSPSAGILFVSPIGKKISKGDILFTIYSETKGELDYAVSYMKDDDMIIIE